MIAGLGLRPLDGSRGRHFLAVAATGRGDLAAARDDGALLEWRHGAAGQVAPPSSPITVALRAGRDSLLAGTAGGGVVAHQRATRGWEMAWRSGTSGRAFRYAAALAPLEDGSCLAGTGEGLARLGVDGVLLSSWDERALGCGYVTGLWAGGECWAVGTLAGLAVTDDGGASWGFLACDAPVRDAMPLAGGWLTATDAGLRVLHARGKAGPALGERRPTRRLLGLGDVVAAIGPGGILFLGGTGSILRDARLEAPAGMLTDGCATPGGGLALASTDGLWLLDAEALDHAIEGGAVDS